MKAQVIVKLQGAILPANSVQVRNPVFNVPRRVPIAFLPLIFLGIEVFFAAEQGLILAELESAIDAVETRKRGRKGYANHEGRPAAILQRKRQNIRRVGKEIPTEILAHVRLRQLGEILDELLFRISPSEISVALREAGLGQRFHHFRFGKSLGEKNDIRILCPYAADQEFPK